jgi:chromosomal replication initiation ATPase DnaA
VTPRIVTGRRKVDRGMVRAVRGSVRPGPRRELPYPGRVVAAVESLHGIDFAELRGESRNRQVCYVRHLAMFALKRHARMPIVDIERLFNRDHATVIAGIRRIELEQRTRWETERDVDEIEARVMGYRKELLA